MKRVLLYVGILIFGFVLLLIFWKTPPTWIAKLKFWEKQDQNNTESKAVIPETLPLDKAAKKRGRKPGSSHKPRTGLGK